MERAVLGNRPMFSVLASVCAIVKIRKSTKIAKPECNVALRPDPLTYPFMGGIVVGELAKRLLTFQNLEVNLASEWRIFVASREEGICFRLAQFREHWRIIRRNLVRAPNYIPIHIPRGACCDQ